MGFQKFFIPGGIRNFANFLSQIFPEEYGSQVQRILKTESTID